MRAIPVAVAAVVLLITVPFSYSAEEDARSAKIMYSAWRCSTYAEIKGDMAEQNRLFKLGYEKGRQFMDAALGGTITDEERRNFVPIIVGMLMAGPTPEFVLGRIFESAASRAYDDIATKDANGMPLAPADYVRDERLTASIASTKYMQANCEILR